MHKREEHKFSTLSGTPLLTETTFTIQPGETLLIFSKMLHLEHIAPLYVPPKENETFTKQQEWE